MDLEEVLSFWIEEREPEAWYKADAALDDEIRARFMLHWEAARAGKLGQWKCSARGMLAYIIVTDQFSRNMFRGDPRSFATDGLALGMAQKAIQRGADRFIDEPERQFFFMPLMHSESLMMRERGVRLFMTRMSPENMNLLHARAHREVIRRFGRIPYRNEALGRHTTGREQTFLDDGGYGAAVRMVQTSA